jgi:hypothetical protein
MLQHGQVAAVVELSIFVVKPPKRKPLHLFALTWTAASPCPSWDDCCRRGSTPDEGG